MKVSQFYDMVGALLEAIDDNKPVRIATLALKLKAELWRISKRKEAGYKLPFQL